jgi:quinol monooxygenase YgiN
MVHVIVTMHVESGRLEEFLAVARELAPLVRSEAGCLRYQYTVDTPSPLPIQEPIDDHRVTLLEEWESSAALAAHTAAPHMKQYGPVLAAVRTGAVSARVTRPIGDG